MKARAVALPETEKSKITHKLEILFSRPTGLTQSIDYTF